MIWAELADVYDVDTIRMGDGIGLEGSPTKHRQ